MLNNLNQLIAENKTLAVIRKPKANGYEWYSASSEENAGKLEFIPFSEHGTAQPIVLYKGNNFTSGNTNSSSESPKITSFEEYESCFNEMLNKLKSGHLDKVILSRVKWIDTRLIDFETYFSVLCEMNPDAFCYVLNYNSTQWVGATPELLLKTEGEKVFSNAVAGTRSNNSSVDWTEKEYQEHRYVSDYIANAILKNGVLVSKNGPVEKKAGSVKHLVTKIEGKSDNPAKLLKTLHPTPAVCGTPKNDAMSTILETEPHDREFYTGYIRITDRQSEESYVNLRCMKIVDGFPYLFVGGGLTSESKLQSEWDETEEKAKTLITPMKKI